jgi:hypothetical protein
MTEPDPPAEERVNNFLADLINDGGLPGGGMIQTWTISGTYMDGDGDYRNFVLAAPEQRLTTTLGLTVFADELYREEVRRWGRANGDGELWDDAPEDE